MPFADTGAMNDHLAEIARTVAPGADALLMLDGAGWHGGHALVVLDNVSLVVLPPCSPQLNPVENVWQYLRDNRLAISAIVDACCNAWNRFAETPKPSPPSLPGNGHRSFNSAVGIRAESHQSGSYPQLSK
jgi:hypothetical protein